MAKCRSCYALRYEYCNDCVERVHNFQHQGDYTCDVYIICSHEKEFNEQDDSTVNFVGSLLGGE